MISYCVKVGFRGDLLLVKLNGVYLNIYLITNNLFVKMIFPKHVSVHKKDGNYELNGLQFVPSSLYQIYNIRNGNMWVQTDTI